MEVKAGARLRSSVCATEVVVVKAPSGDVEITCCGVPMVDQAAGDAPAGGPATPVAGQEMLLGKRYADEEVGIELLVTKAGDGPLAVNGTPVPVKSAKPLPSSD